MSTQTIHVIRESDARAIRDAHRLKGQQAEILPERDECGRFVVRALDRRVRRSKGLDES